MPQIWLTFLSLCTPSSEGGPPLRTTSLVPTVGSYAMMKSTSYLRCDELNRRIALSRLLLAVIMKLQYLGIFSTGVLMSKPEKMISHNQKSCPTLLFWWWTNCFLQR